MSKVEVLTPYFFVFLVGLRIDAQHASLRARNKDETS